ANVTLSNATFSNSTLSNATTGYFEIPVYADGSYNLTGAKSKYTTETDSITVTGGTNISYLALHPIYNLTIKARDYATNKFMTDFYAYKDGVGTPATNGSVIYSVDYSFQTISVQAVGYLPLQKSIFVPSDKEVIFDLISSVGAPPGLQGIPHNVKFTVQDAYGNKKPGVTVTAQGYGTTLGNWSWLKGLLGIDYQTYPLQNVSMTGVTGSDGSIVFLMVETIYYKLDFVNASAGINKTVWLYPRDDQYIIFVSKADTVWGKYTTQIKDAIQVNVTKSIVNSTHAFINTTYLDKSNGTTALTIYVNQSIQGDVTNQTVISSWTGSGNLNNTARNFSISGYSGQSYFVHVVAQHITYGKVDMTYAVNFDKTIEVT
ncbi:MAG: hypothetical protein Q8L68_02385, partial [Methylococcales bacterium]|nr:hypothetical protein [Methylococcales bacterium]